MADIEDGQGLALHPKVPSLPVRNNYDSNIIYMRSIAKSNSKGLEVSNGNQQLV